MKIRLAVLTSMLLHSANPALAGPADYVHVPAVDHRETEIGIKYGTYRSASRQRDMETAFGIGYGVTRWWSTELYVAYQGPTLPTADLDAFEWENIVLLTSPGRHPIDMGLILEVERPRDRVDGLALVYGPLMQAVAGRIQLNLNLLLTRRFGGDAGKETTGAYQFQAKWAARETAGIGIQAFGEVGRWNRWGAWNKQSHRIGPALFWNVAFGDNRKIALNAAVLFEAAHRSRGETVRAEIAYEF